MDTEVGTRCEGLKRRIYRLDITSKSSIRARRGLWELWEYGPSQRFTHDPPRLRRGGLNRKSSRSWSDRGTRLSSGKMTACPTAVNGRLLLADPFCPKQIGVAIDYLEHTHAIPIVIAVREGAWLLRVSREWLGYEVDISGCNQSNPKIPILGRLKARNEAPIG